MKKEHFQNGQSMRVEINSKRISEDQIAKSWQGILKVIKEIGETETRGAEDTEIESNRVFKVLREE